MYLYIRAHRWREIGSHQLHALMFKPCAQIYTQFLSCKITDIAPFLYITYAN